MTLLKKLATVGFVLLASTLLLTAADDKKADAPKDAPKKAVCVLTPTKKFDTHVHGKITFTQTDAGVEVAGEITGLTPGKHGFHIHEFGDLSSDDGLATGGHFNPDMHKHGGPGDAEHHAGDFGNIEADKDGKATVKMTLKDLSLGGPHTILGRALIVHAKEDDLKTQPSGNAGDRIAQGVIGAAK
jgi:Cu-Zn family superoxide dismutase